MLKKDFDVTISTRNKQYTFKVNKEKYLSSIEKDYPEDTLFSQEELLSIRNNILAYPSGGLGEVLIATNNKRGYKRDPNYNKFTTHKANSNSLRCPVVMLKEDYSTEISFKEHLRQFRRLRKHISVKENISLKDARFLYNYLLANDPIELSTFY